MTNWYVYGLAALVAIVAFGYFVLRRRFSSDSDRSKKGKGSGDPDALHDWGDLVLRGAQFEQLQELVALARFRRQESVDRGFTPTGPNSVIALFVGAAGTGKTLAAETISHELGLRLFRVDLQRVVNKYIGETEKNIDHILEQAADLGSVLFFDESDVLFGRRGEVKDARDRYANLETSYLLQRIESYDGLVLLETNVRDSIDPAFTRRMHFVVEFPLPVAEHRKRIWERAFPKSFPIADDVDLSVLAKELNLTGGNIKSIALHAAYLASAKGQVIDMASVIDAVRHEQVTTGMVVDVSPLTNALQTRIG